MEQDLFFAGVFLTGFVFSFLIIFNTTRSRESFWFSLIFSFIWASVWFMTWSLLGLIWLWETWLGPFVNHMFDFKKPKV